MRGMRRYFVWSFDSENFRYDRLKREFISDPPMNSSDPNPNSLSLENNLQTHHPFLIWYLEALIELNQEFANFPADEWETGQLLKVYGASIEAAAGISPVRQIFSSARLVTHKKYDRKLLHLSREADRTLCTFCRHLESFFDGVINLSEIAISRRAPDAFSKIVEILSADTPKKSDPLNAVLSDLGLRKQSSIQSVVDLWLFSLERPNSVVGHKTIEDELLNGSYWVDGIERHHDVLRSQTIVSKVRYTTELFQACQVILQRTLLCAGQVVLSATVEMDKI